MVFKFAMKFIKNLWFTLSSHISWSFLLLTSISKNHEIKNNIINSFLQKIFENFINKYEYFSKRINCKGNIGIWSNNMDNYF